LQSCLTLSLWVQQTYPFRPTRSRPDPLHPRPEPSDPRSSGVPPSTLLTALHFRLAPDASECLPHFSHLFRDLPSAFRILPRSSAPLPTPSEKIGVSRGPRAKTLSFRGLPLKRKVVATPLLVPSRTFRGLVPTWSFPVFRGTGSLHIPVLPVPLPRDHSTIMSLNCPRRPTCR